MIETILQILRQGIRVHLDLVVRLNEDINPIEQTYTATCEFCHWSQNGYKSQDSAQRALRTHQHLHCTAYADQMGWIEHMHGGE